MKNSFALVYTFLPFFFFLLVLVSSNIIQDSCDKVAKSMSNINYDFCVASLEENPKSKTATRVENLLPISVDIAISNATKINSIISKLLENKNLENYTRMCLEDCSELYSDAGSSLQSASHSVESKAYKAAIFTLSAVLTDSDTCEEGFKEKEGLVSPLLKENNDFYQLTAISLAFASMLQ
ncbi:hypothetical protein CRYUN_Cryun19dG0152900 [Craigia yunnanensis]